MHECPTRRTLLCLSSGLSGHFSVTGGLAVVALSRPLSLYPVYRVPGYLCTCVPVYLCTCVPVYLCTCVPVYLCTCVPVYLCTCVPGYLGTWVPGYLGMACTISLECTIQKLYRSDFCIVKSIQFVYDLVYTGIVHKLYRSDYKKSWDCTSNSQIYTISIQLYVQLTIVYTMSV